MYTLKVTKSKVTLKVTKSHLKKTHQVKEGQVKETTAITFTNLGQMALVILLTS